MNLDDLQAKLLQAGRHATPPDRVPHAFEQRIMAHLTARLRHDPWAEWTAAFWRAALSGLAVALITGAMNMATPAPSADPTDVLDLAAMDPESFATTAEPW